MNRRGFLKRIGQVITGLAVAPSVIKAKKPGLGKDILSANPSLLGNIKTTGIAIGDCLKALHLAINQCQSPTTRIVMHPHFYSSLLIELESRHIYYKYNNHIMIWIANKPGSCVGMFQGARLFRGTETMKNHFELYGGECLTASEITNRCLEKIRMD